MRLRKFNENVHDDYVEILHDLIKNDNKVINGFEFNYDRLQGVFEWFSTKFVIYATPYWEDENNIPINIHDVDSSEEIEQDSIILPVLKSQSDVNDVKNYYYQQIDKITLKLNKIVVLVDIIPMILSNIPYIEIHSNVNGVMLNKLYSYDDMKLGNLEEQMNIYNIIYEKYPEYFLAKKFNM